MRDSRQRPFARMAGAVLFTTMLAAAACGRSTPAPPVIDREAFITSYVELRAAAIRSGTAEVPESVRAGILAAQGVDEDALLAFVEYHGEDVDFMRAVWDDVEARLDALRMELVPREGR